MYRSRIVLIFATLLAILGASAPAAAAGSRRVVVEYQAQCDGDGTGAGPGLTQQGAGVRDVVVVALHVDADWVVQLNDDPPDSSRYTQMWADLATMQSQGVRVEVMVGGAAQGSFQR